MNCHEKPRAVCDGYATRRERVTVLPLSSRRHASTDTGAIPAALSA
jgi:hypothetical protein